MDKFSVATFVSAVVALVVAAINIVKLVNDKESNVTDVKQAWALSLRSALAELVATAESYAKELYNLKRSEVGLRGALEAIEVDTSQKALKNHEFQEDAVRRGMERCNVHSHNLQLAYAATKLHFEPNDSRFDLIEPEIKKCFDNLKELRDVKNIYHWEELRKNIDASTLNVSVEARSILHVEWRSVKTGEPIYQWTKKLSMVFLVLMLVAVFLLGYFVFSGSGVSPQLSPSSQSAQESLPMTDERKKERQHIELRELPANSTPEGA